MRQFRTIQAVGASSGAPIYIYIVAAIYMYIMDMGMKCIMPTQMTVSYSPIPLNAPPPEKKKTDPPPVHHPLFLISCWISSCTPASSSLLALLI